MKTTGKSPIEDLLDSLGSKLNQKTSNNEEVARLLKVILFGIWLLVAVVVPVVKYLKLNSSAITQLFAG